MVQNCTICLCNFTTGEHHIAALKCGHVFGYSCIIRWYEIKKSVACPTCFVKSYKSDIRKIFIENTSTVEEDGMDSIIKKYGEQKTLLEELYVIAKDMQLALKYKNSATENFNPLSLTAQYSLKSNLIPELITYDPVNNQLFIVVFREQYEVLRIDLDSLKSPLKTNVFFRTTEKIKVLNCTVDGLLIVYNNKIKIIEPSIGALLFEYEHRENIIAAFLIKDNRFVLFEQKGGILFYDILRKKEKSYNFNLFVNTVKKYDESFLILCSTGIFLFENGRIEEFCTSLPIFITVKNDTILTAERKEDNEIHIKIRGNIEESFYTGIKTRQRPILLLFNDYFLINDGVNLKIFNFTGELKGRLNLKSPLIKACSIDRSIFCFTKNDFIIFQ